MTERSTAYVPRIKEVLVWPDPKLKRETERVAVFDEQLQELVADMFATMGAMEGVGLAAPQIGVSQMLIVLRIEPEKPIIIINPTITVLDEEEYEWEEGCLSVPGYFKKNKRPKNIAVRFQDVEGNEQHVHFSGLYAFAIQHEVDHLNGRCFVDGMARWRWPHIKKKIRKQQPLNRQKAEAVRVELDKKRAMTELYKQSDEGKAQQ